jgi:SPP1 family predicted phage head-tail adaptor
VKSGRLTESIEIQRSTSGVNDYGTPADVWERLTSLRAERIDATTEEFMRGFGASDEEAVVFRIRYVESVTNADRVMWKGQPFNIKQVTPIGRRKGFDLRCTRVMS